MDQEEFNHDPNEILIAYTDAGQNFELLHFDTPYAVYTRGIPTTCSIAGGVLKCSNSGEGSNVLQLCCRCGGGPVSWECGREWLRGADPRGRACLYGSLPVGVRLQYIKWMDLHTMPECDTG